MVQLSLIGEPAEPKEPNGRRRLQMLIHEAVAPHLARLGLARHAIDETAELVAEHLSRRQPGGKSSDGRAADDEFGDGSTAVAHVR